MLRRSGAGPPLGVCVQEVDEERPEEVLAAVIESLEDAAIEHEEA